MAFGGSFSRKAGAMTFETLGEDSTAKPVCNDTAGRCVQQSSKQVESRHAIAYLYRMSGNGSAR